MHTPRVPSQNVKNRLNTHYESSIHRQPNYEFQDCYDLQVEERIKIFEVLEIPCFLNLMEFRQMFLLHLSLICFLYMCQDFIKKDTQINSLKNILKVCI